MGEFSKLGLKPQIFGQNSKKSSLSNQSFFIAEIIESEMAPITWDSFHVQVIQWSMLNNHNLMF